MYARLKTEDTQTNDLTSSASPFNASSAQILFFDERYLVTGKKELADGSSSSEPQQHSSTIVSSNLSFTLHRPAQAVGAKRFEPSLPWESRFGLFHTVVDNDTNVLLYYDVLSTPDGVNARVSDINRTIGLAVSSDGGLSFKPLMVGVRDYGGYVGRNNNIIFPLQPNVRFGSFSVWCDDNPSSTSRLTMCVQYDGPGGYGIYFMGSQDGVAWTRLSDTPAWNHGRSIPGGGPGGSGKITDETQEIVQWSALDNRYYVCLSPICR